MTTVSDEMVQALQEAIDKLMAAGVASEEEALKIVEDYVKARFGAADQTN